jgi:hypothetical protein
MLIFQKKHMDIAPLMHLSIINHHSVVKLLEDVASGEIKYSPEDCPSYQHNLKIISNGEMGENNHHNEL